MSKTSKKPVNKPLRFGLILFIVLFLTVVMFGLKNEVNTTTIEVPIQESELKEKAEENADPFSTSEQTLEQQVEEFNEVLQVGDITYTFHELTSNQNIGGVYGQNADDKFLLLNISILNEGVEPLLIDTSLFELVSADSQKFVVDGVASVYANVDTDFFLHNLHSGTEQRGYIVFDIPEEFHDNTLKLKVSDGMWGTESGEIPIR